MSSSAVLLFNSTSTILALLLPLLVILLFTLLIPASLSRPGARLESVGRALFSYGAQSAGILFMLMGGVPTIYSVLGFVPFSAVSYVSLLALFAMGGLTYLWHENELQRIDAASKAVPQMIFACTWKTVGLILILLSIVAAGMEAMMQETIQSSWWALPLGLVIAGMALLHIHYEIPVTPAFSSQPMMAAKVLKPAAAKTSKGKKKRHK